ncbi:MAG: alkaline phosphatase family protein [Actinomycetota bacterium]|nr:alkaline phosphatase family protein [Actinomycetota bacterium]
MRGASQTSSAPKLPSAPRYGSASLADVAPALLDALGVPGPNPFGFQPVRHACLLLVDGLGFELLSTHRDVAPFLTSACRYPIDAPYPTTTVASLASITTGRPPGEHGLLGPTVALADFDRPMNVLKWRLHGIGPEVDLTHVISPERFQPVPTVLERATAAGLDPVTVGPIEHEHSALSRAVLRCSSYVAVSSLAELVDASARALATGPRFVYTYYGGLDHIGHREGVASGRWLEELAGVDAAFGALVERLPAETMLVVVGDHGMVDVDAEGLVDVAQEPALLDGVRLLAGEPRLRHVHAKVGAEQDVLGAWRERHGGIAWVLSREQTLAEGWFGPVVFEGARARIGDVVAAAHLGVAVVQSDLDPLQGALVGHHGSLTDAERHVPLVIVRHA